MTAVKLAILMFKLNKDRALPPGSLKSLYSEKILNYLTYGIMAKVAWFFLSSHYMSDMKFS